MKPMPYLVRIYYYYYDKAAKKIRQHTILSKSINQQTYHEIQKTIANKKQQKTQKNETMGQPGFEPGLYAV